MAIRFEPLDLALKISTQGGADFIKRPFNAGLGLIDGAGKPRPYLAEALPQLRTDSWRIFDDGRMETTHRLRAGLTWHDGQPLSADDFAFAWRVYTRPTLGVFSPQPQDQMDEVLAPDPRTLVIRWRSLYPDASALTENRDGSLEPLPRHLLERPFSEVLQDPAARDSFLNLPFWSAEYVGAGPYRLERWEPGASLEAVAFDGHVLGRPRIERIVMRLMSDENAVLTNMLAGNFDVATRFTLRFEHATVLKREWAAAGRSGVFQWAGANIHPIIFQFRPEYVKTPELLDVRVRKALAHASDRQALVDALFDGEGQVPQTFVAPEEPFYPEVDRSIVKYPYDPRRTEQLMLEAGFMKDREGFFANAAGVRFQPEYQTLAATVFERAQTIVAETWRRAGIDNRTSVLPAAQIRDNQVRATFPSISALGNVGLIEFLTLLTGTAANRWFGQNRGAWSDPEYDRFWDVYKTTLEPTERHRQLVQMTRILSEEVPGFPLLFNYQPTFAHLSNVVGPDVGVPPTALIATTHFWNIHEWELH
jgi:peptide/nickel transport system substrate-binding protein